MWPKSKKNPFSEKKKWEIPINMKNSSAAAIDSYELRNQINGRENQ